jgi:hypothetical protein
MIPKGNQRGGGQQLATHLLNSYDNDRVEIVDMRGAVAQDLHGAFAEWRAQAKVTNCRKYLYSLSVNPDHRQGPFAREKYFDFIARTEAKLGLADQPRAVVFHVKGGREHCHVVWSRIDAKKSKAVQMSHDRQQLRKVAQQFAKDHGITLPAGMQKDRGKERFKDRQKTENLAEKQQQERSGEPKEERLRNITAAWVESKTGREFVQALEARGYYLARGDKRAYVVVDRFGEIHSLVRQIEGVKTKEVKARLADYALDRIPGVAAAQEFAKQQLDAKLKQAEPGLAKNPDQGQSPEERRKKLASHQEARREVLQERRAVLERQHSAERDALKELQDAEKKGLLNERLKKQPRGIVGFLARITGIRAFVSLRDKKQEHQRDAEHKRQTGALQRRHERERQDFSRHARALVRVEKRENRSLQAALRRDHFKTLDQPARNRVPERTPEQEAKLARARMLAREFQSSAALPGRAPDLTAAQRAQIAAFKKDRRNSIVPPFNEAARKQLKTPESEARDPAKKAGTKAPVEGITWDDSLTATFNQSAGGAGQTKNGDDKTIKNGREARGDSGSLTEAFRRAQEQRQREIEDARARKPRSPRKDRER